VTASVLPAKVSGNLRSIRAMLLAVAMFALMDTAMKLLSASFAPLQVAALRALASLPLVCAWMAWRGAFRSVFDVRWSLHLLRTVIGIAMLALFVYGVRTLSLGEAYAIFFIAPTLITVLSVFVLKERVDAPRWIAIGVGMLGVLVVLRPSGDGLFSLSGVAMLVAAVCYAVSAVAGRILARTDRSEHMVFWLMLLTAAGAGVLAAPHWVPVEIRHLPLLALLAVSGFFAQLAITEAFNHGEASVVAPFEYTALAFGVALDWLIWRTLPDQATLLGAAIIIGSGLYLIRHETRPPGTHAGGEHP
jgi:drug/metabolite transporter (DMT)-like permease